jgi:hypothetical protein
MSDRPTDDRFLARPTTIRALWIAFVVVLVASVIADFFVDRHGMSFGFNAWYGFLSCVALVLIAKGLGLYLKRPEDYYDS